MIIMDFPNYCRIWIVITCTVLRIHYAFGQCSTPPTIANGVATAGTYAVGTNAIYTCATNYVLTDTAVTCSTSGGVDQWSTDLPSCICNADACQDLPVWVIALLAVLGALLFIALIILCLLPCCCCKGCPCYCFGDSGTSNVKHHYNRKEDHERENIYHNKDHVRHSTPHESNVYTNNGPHIINNEVYNNTDNSEYYYDIDRGVYIHRQNGTQYKNIPDGGIYVGRYSSKSSPDNETYIIDGKRPHTAMVNSTNYTLIDNQVRPSTRNQFRSPSQIFVVDSSRNNKTRPSPQMVVVDSLPQQPKSQPSPKYVVMDNNQTQTGPKYIVVDNNKPPAQPPPITDSSPPHKIEPKTQYIVVDNKQTQAKDSPAPQFVVVDENMRPTTTTTPQPPVVVVNEKPDPGQKKPQYVVVNNSSLKPSNDAHQPHYVVKNDQRSKSVMADPSVVYTDQKGTKPTSQRRINTVPVKRPNREYATDYDTDDYYASESDVVKKHSPTVRYKFQSAIDRVMGVNKFRKPIQRRTPAPPNH